MLRPLDGIRVAITENRYPEQLTQLLERLGATVFSCPLVKESPIENSTGARRFISICENTQIDYIVFYTGVGVDLLFKAENRPELIAQSKIIARGPKAVNALRKVGIEPQLVAESATTEGIVRTLSKENLKGKTVLVQLYGQENPDLHTALQKKGATVIGVSIYSYAQASDTQAIESLVKKIAARDIDAITFTSATQVPFLFKAAEALVSIEQFRACLNKDIVVASIGEVTSRALRDFDVEPRVCPAESKMGPLAKALGEYFGSRKV